MSTNETTAPVPRQDQAECNDCETTEGIFSTPCGSYCPECFTKHMDECEICRSENAKFPLY